MKSLVMLAIGMFAGFVLTHSIEGVWNHNTQEAFAAVLLIPLAFGACMVHFAMEPIK
jgi:hypothetical protein